MDLFIYTYNVRTVQGETVVTVYGLDINSKTVYIDVPFHPSITVYCDFDGTIDSLQEYFPSTLVSVEPFQAKLLYDSSHTLRTFYSCTFKNDNDFHRLGTTRKNQYGQNPITIYENKISIYSQFTSSLGLPTAGWVRYNTVDPPIQNGLKPLYDYRPPLYTFDGENFKPRVGTWFFTALPDDLRPPPQPTIFAFDGEMYSSKAPQMPNPNIVNDVVFQISISIRGKNIHRDILLSLGEITPLNDIELYTFPTEFLLLHKFCDLVKEINPNIVTGYNISGFDNKYIWERCNLHKIYQESAGNIPGQPTLIPKLTTLGMDGRIGELITEEWSSTAFGKQTITTITMPGRIIFDLLPYCRRELKLPDYKLNTVSNELISASKDPITPRMIFEAYETMDSTLLTNVGLYCVKDSVLVNQLFEKLDLWVGLTEMANVCKVLVGTLYSKGQQIRVFSKVYDYCMENGIVMNRVEGKDSTFQGATVMEPTPGIYEYVVPFDFCFTGDTLVSMANGCSRRINRIVHDTSLLGYKDKKIGHYSSVNGLQEKGKKRIVKITLQDGKTIKCTPEHRFMLEDGENWCEAKDLAGKRVLCGLDYPEDKICSLESSWELNVCCVGMPKKPEKTYRFDMKSYDSREASLAFARMLGYVLADGSILLNKYGYMESQAYFGNMYDATQYVNDIKLVCKYFGINNKDPHIYHRSGESNKKGETFTININRELSRIFHHLDGMVVGQRSTQAMKLPEFILDVQCPLSIVREFMAGLYGGDASAPCLTAVNSWSGLTFKWTTVQQYVPDMVLVFNQLAQLLSKFGIIVTPLQPRLHKEKCDRLKPKDDLPRHDCILTIYTEQILLYAKSIGFRYCNNKTYKLEIASSWIHMREETIRQHDQVLNRFSELHSKFTTCKLPLEQARLELLSEEPAISEESLCLNVTRLLHWAKKRNNEKSIRRRFKGFIKPKQYLEELGVPDWFQHKTYVTGREEMTLPTFRKLVIDVMDCGYEDVYDIEVEDVHNFLVSGIVVHNCSLYPTLIRSYNIDFSTLVTDQSIPDSRCHVMDWKENDGRQFKYRFLKEPKGVLPTILETLMEARTSTRQLMKTVTDPLYKNVLNKRQLAYKIICNSSYGILGASHGMLPLTEGARTITAMGRLSLQKAAKHLVERYQCKVTYEDTDSVYTNMPHIPPTQLWETAERMEQEMWDEEIFPRPMKLEFENDIYAKFFIEKKKKYIYTHLNRDGTVNEELGMKGLDKRDACLLSKELYRKVITLVFKDYTKPQILDVIQDTMNQLCSYTMSKNMFTMTKSIQDVKKVTPAHIHLINRLKLHGIHFGTGDRVDYLITTRPGKKLADKLEHPDIQKKYNDVCKIDVYYYLNLMTPTMSSLLLNLYGCNDWNTFVQLRLLKHKILQQLLLMFSRAKVRLQNRCSDRITGHIERYFTTP